MKPKYLLLVFFILFYFVVRIPSYIIPSSGEEGEMVEIFYNHPVNPNYLLIGIIQGEKLYCAPEHPALTYEIISFYGRLWQMLISFDSWNVTALGIFARFAFSLFQFLIVLAFLLICSRRKEVEDPLPLMAFIIGLSLTPQVIAYSISLQSDGSIGSLMAGMLLLSLLAYHYNMMDAKKTQVLVFACSLFYGFGKTEWTLAFFVAIVVSATFVLAKKYVDQSSFRSTFNILSLAFIGLLVGNLISYFYDPFDYLGGFNVMWRIGKVSLHPLEIISTRWQMVLINLILFAIALVGLFPALKKLNVFYLLFFVWGAALLAGFLATSWAAEPRYYAPSFLVLLGILFLTYEQIDIRRAKPWLWIATVVISIFAIVDFSGKISTEKFSELLNFQSVNEISTPRIATDCIAMMGVGEALVTGEDFVSTPLGFEGASVLAEKYGETICQP